MQTPQPSKGKSFFRTDRASITICLVISLIAWFLTKMSKEYSHNLTYPVSYNIPAHLTLSGSAVKDVNAELRSTGWALLRLALSQDNDTVEIEAGPYQQHEFSSRILLSNALKEAVNDQVEILSVDPEQVALELVEKHSRVVPVSLPLQIPLAAFHALKGEVQIIPDSITVYGPEFLLANFREWPISLELSGPLSQTFHTIIPLRDTEIMPGVYTSEQDVAVTIEIEELTEKELFVPINVVDSLAQRIQIFPDEALVKCLVGLSKFDAVTEQDFTLVAHPQGDRSSKVYDVHLVRWPAHASMLEYSPKRVEYFLINP